ncbi:MAG: adenosylmethionine decarboxylase [Bacillota bacterium]|nr:adenosylmethionine decarboxylase [Bacillota bacterium]
MQKSAVGKRKLHGFNNLTKSLCFNMYDICYTKTVQDRNAYIEYIDEQYNADRLTGILERVSTIIGANVINIAKQDYDPQGASVTILICEDPMLAEEAARNREKDGLLSETVLVHLDKSHITVHTYPEYHPDGGVCTFRADIDVSTCGEISPLNALNYLVSCFDADIMTLDYRVRGFTRDVKGKKMFIDHEISSIQNYLEEEVKNRYQMIDVNIYQENLFHTKCKLKEFDLNNYLFGFSKADIHRGEADEIGRRLNKEMNEIFYGKNLPLKY